MLVTLSCATLRAPRASADASGDASASEPPTNGSAAPVAQADGSSALPQPAASASPSASPAPSSRPSPPPPPDPLAESYRAAGYVWPPVPRAQRPIPREARYVFGVAITPDWGYLYLPLGGVRFSNGMRTATGSDLQYSSFGYAAFGASLVAEVPWLLLATGGMIAFAGSQYYVEWRTVAAAAIRYRFALFAVGPALRVWQFNPALFQSSLSPPYAWQPPVGIDAALELRAEVHLPNRCRTERSCQYFGYALVGDIPITGVGAFYVSVSLVLGLGRI